MNNKIKTEILAPAGTYESLVAAVRCGADAVYLGGKDLNARAKADNFDKNELEQAVGYCHARDVKLYLTLNTIVSDDELKTAVSIIEHACAIGVDALIVQDLGLAHLALSIAPALPLHASTQMSVQTLEGVNELYELGFKRVVLPREISADEIQEISNGSDIELEMFVHGAQCMSLSGQCYMSAMLGSRSGNRGFCAQPCRLPFSVENGTGYDLSLKDLSLITNLNDKAFDCVTSLKIEGRMKRPEYVAAAVTACRKALENELNDEDLFDLKSVFSRSGFTDGYYLSKRGKEMFGTRQHEDVVAANPVFSRLAKLYEKEPQITGIEFALTCIQGEALSLSAKANGKSIFVSSETIVEKALNKPITKQTIEKQLKKCGGTMFYTQDMEILLDDGVNVPVSAINALRREALDALEKRLAQTEPIPFYANNIKTLKEHKAKKMKLYCRFGDVSQIPENLDNIGKITVPLSTSSKELETLLSKDLQVSLEIPRGIMGTSETIKSQIKRAKEAGVTSCCVGTLDGFKLAKDEGMKTHAGFGMNIYNSQSLEFLKNLGADEALISIESTLQQATTFTGELPRGIIAYGSIPLMLTRNCPNKNAKTCAQCDGKSSLTDRKGIVFPITCNNGFSEVLNSRPIYMADRLREIQNMDFITLYFTIETKAECQRIIDSFLSGESPSGEFTRGLYYRGVL